MARLARGEDVLGQARLELLRAKDADEIRVLQAVIFPLLYGMCNSLTAEAVGRSPRWVTKERNRYIRHAGIMREGQKHTRNRAYMTKEEEQDFLLPFFESAKLGGILEVSKIHEALSEHLGCRVALTTVYNLLHRHGWRKLAPDKRNVSADVEKQETWEKNCLKSLEQ